ncbi:PREDICTED: deoxyribonuclease-1-like 2 isoform X1 [Poecilia mexicana]|uniref:deoxyribonuclease-1-like 2 isoform X1 n=1 Tax=Poecilia mexicana TaxID=48701 RepID=UPI00072E3C35|nr:PREDICTED: deoxyribonuclease-1-like 2 isoform X1 [Poecilia mexicana]
MRGRSSSVGCLLLLFCSLMIGGAAGLRICSYNIQRFNTTKAADYRVMHTLTKIVSRCDICVLQEVVDPELKAVKALVASLNRTGHRYDEHRYEYVSSQSLGKSSDDLQQYVFIYRTHLVKQLGQHQYEGKAFVRPPFAVHFSCNKTDIKEFVLVPLHSDPDQAVQEIDWLYDVFEEVSTKWNNTNVMFLGDFHAGCAYVTRNDKKKIRLFTNSNFSWLIGDREDTTVTDTTSCPYDRIVVHGQSFLKAIRPFSGKVFNFGKEFRLRQSKVLKLSDHYPIEVRLKGSAPLLQATPLLVLFGAIIRFFLPAL